MNKIDFSPENISRLSQEAIDEAIEQHRLNGQAIAQTDEDGNVVEIQSEDITPLNIKLQQRRQQQASKAS